MHGQSQALLSGAQRQETKQWAQPQAIPSKPQETAPYWWPTERWDRIPREVIHKYSCIETTNSLAHKFSKTFQASRPSKPLEKNQDASVLQEVG